MDETYETCLLSRAQRAAAAGRAAAAQRVCEYQGLFLSVPCWRKKALL